LKITLIIKDYKLQNEKWNECKNITKGKRIKQKPTSLPNYKLNVKVELEN